MVFKAQLFALSGVQPSRQKVMVKGAVVKDDTWGDIKMRDGMMLLMMGSAEELPTVPTEEEQPMFVEDMTPEQLAAKMDLPPGLANLGNTCYINATIQCLKTVPELKEALVNLNCSSSCQFQMITECCVVPAVRDLFVSLDIVSNSFPPVVLLSVLDKFFPQFSEKNEDGIHYQQDANEFWTEVVRCLQRQLVATEADEAIASQGAVGFQRSFIDRYFAGQFAITMKCIECEDEPVTTTAESFYQFSCFIQKEVKYLHTGLQSRMQETITKHSTVLSRDAKFLKTCKLSRLPAYLTIQMVRFFYKEKEGVNAKILKDVKFPMSLDVFDLCSEEVKKKLTRMRDRFRKDDEVKAAQKAKSPVFQEKEKALNKMDKDEEEEEEKPVLFREPFSFPDDIGSNNSGYYELQAVLTHKGRSSVSGHYVAWTRKKGDEWVMFDDHRVSPVTAADVQKLSGGGDWHCAYVLLYGPRVLEREATQEEIAEMEAEELRIEEERRKEEERKNAPGNGPLARLYKERKEKERREKEGQEEMK
ncbi:hypothetical protein NP493_23g06032 [Ridgeia piscesae]|uniref:Ubiquitin carboxyl-terminal hydrolase n=1 Tax=Ridgeia piscesae TaxID=27915 RepID=A0AAD9UKK6_RIDPI|nr:hypothetical protein NP493_23g06032 [Ridgeia piscesae]